MAPKLDQFVVQFQASEIRDLLKSKAHCLRAGFSANDIIIQTLNDIRDHYLKQVGLSTYLSQMLGPLAVIPMAHCQLFQEDGSQLTLCLNGRHTQPVNRFLAKQFRGEQLPFKVEVHHPARPDRVDVRYL